MISNSNSTLLFEASHRLWTGIIGEKGKEVKSFWEEILENFEKVKGQKSMPQVEIMRAQKFLESQNKSKNE